jgi:ABC-2 type transport system ATP-binding protein
MTYFQNRLQEVSDYFVNGDTHLGYRRLLDAAIETGNFAVYEAVLQFCDWYDAADPAKDKAAITLRVQDLLPVLQKGHKGDVAQPEAIRLKAEGITKRYAHGRFNLSETDVELTATKIVGLVGENGNGKTTLLRLLHGDLKADSGRIQYLFKGGNKAGFPVRTEMAFVPQRPQSWYGSLMDNLQFAAAFTGYKDKENRLWTEIMVARMGLRPFRSYDWSRISSGYKMRFELARTLIRKPQLLLLDEPLANLDILAQQIILEDLRFLAQSHTMPLSVILSSQQLYEVEKVSDHVIFLQNGSPRYQSMQASGGLAIELETTASRDNLQALFADKGLKTISFNGGVYLLYFEGETEFAQVLCNLGEASLPVKYVRDISSSSRRFFDA